MKQFNECKWHGKFFALKFMFTGEERYERDRHLQTERKRECVYVCEKLIIENVYVSECLCVCVCQRERRRGKMNFSFHLLPEKHIDEQ